MIDHIGIGVADFAHAKRFYAAALAPIGYALVMEVQAEVTGGGDAAGFGENGKPDFWISGEKERTSPPAHIAFRAADRKAVDAFYAAALAAGGRDNGAPGLRPHYHENYYAAFVIDPVGHNVEVVCHAAGADGWH